MIDDERVARAALTRLTEPGHPGVSAVVNQGRARALAEELMSGLRDGQLVRDAAPRAATTDPERDLEQAAARGIRFVIPGDREWPTQLDALALTDPVNEMQGVPLGLWTRGPLRLDELAGSVAIVGSRASTTYGEDVARDIAAGLARAGRCVVSGAAFGIDQAAHRGALALDGPSVAVLACGVDRAYPAAHRDLLAHLAGVGAVVAEVPPGSAPLRLRFLARNRIIAGLTRGTVLVEAAVRSGALNTARWADSLSRPLMGVPGPVTSAQSQGVHDRVTSGQAVLVTGPADVLEVVGDAGEHTQEAPRAPATLRDRLLPRHRQVLEAVPVRRPASTDSIARTAGLDLLGTQTALSYLAARGFVVTGGDGWRLGPHASADVPAS